jgi:hypothetical protein
MLRPVRSAVRSCGSVECASAESECKIAATDHHAVQPRSDTLVGSGPRVRPDPSPKVPPMLFGGYKELFIVIATSAATLIGLLFVAVSVSKGRSQAHPQVIREFRAAAALLAFTNPFTVTLYSLVPGTTVGYPAAVVGTIGVMFVAAGIRATVSVPSPLRRRGPQASLILGLLAVFGLQIFFGVALIIHPRHAGDLKAISYILVASLLIGIGRAWELVGDWDTGLFASMARLLGLNAQRAALADPDPEAAPPAVQPAEHEGPDA